jgi:hypothetical protein
MPPTHRLPDGVAPNALEAWQADVLSELRQIRQLLEQQQQQRPPLAAALSRADREVLERLLPATAAVFGQSEPFTSRELVRHPSPGLRVLRRGLSTKQIGRLFMRADRVAVGGFCVQAVGTELNVNLWRVVPA